MNDERLQPVLAAVIERQGYLLLCKRPFHKRHGGLWEFPGGKIHEGEALLQAAARELTEELGVRTVRVGRMLFQRRDPGSDFLIQFVEVRIGGDPKPLEHEEIVWVQPNNLLDYDLAPSDLAFARALLEQRPATTTDA